MNSEQTVTTPVFYSTKSGPRCPQATSPYTAHDFVAQPVVRTTYMDYVVAVCTKCGAVVKTVVNLT